MNNTVRDFATDFKEQRDPVPYALCAGTWSRGGEKKQQESLSE